jgi:uncharacterized lipoprotein YddW (UPF0748 family)
MMKLVSILVTCAYLIPIKGQETDSLHAEFRAVWMTTFCNLDWPKKKGSSKETQIEELNTYFAAFNKSNLNAVIFQVRPAGDAFYSSKLAPWSEWLTGKQGKNPGYDPLKTAIEIAHKNNMEFHAWFNPMRAVSHVKYSSVSPENKALTNPDWVFQYGNTVYFNPGIPEVRAHIVAIILEVVENYSVDGIHFDDYFYPYTIDKLPIPDQETFQKFNRGFENIDDWRRDNIDILIQEVNSAIKKVKPNVKFGVSPLAIWRNKKQDELGSNTNTKQTSYDNLFCDSRKWVQQAWIDYIAPQLYWSRDNRFANYNELIQWWRENSNPKVHLYIGHALYRLDPKSEQHFSLGELEEQIKITRQHTEIHGSIYFRAASFLANPQQFKDAFENKIYPSAVAIPTK